MKTKDFWYDLPEELIAQTPLEQRDTSRLMVLNRNTGDVTHKHFYDILDYLKPGDCLVMNDSRVLPARLLGCRPTGGAVEILLLRDLGDKKWECLAKPGRKLQPGQQVKHRYDAEKEHYTNSGDADRRFNRSNNDTDNSCRNEHNQKRISNDAENCL